MEKRSLEKWASAAICAGAAGVCVYAAFRWLLPVLFPFLLSFGISAVIRPPAKRLSRVTRLPEAGCAVILFVLALALTGTLSVLFLRRMVLEAKELLGRLSASGSPGALLSLLSQSGEGGDEPEWRDFAAEKLGRFLTGALTSLSASLPAWIGRLASGVPGTLIGVVVTLISGFYFCTRGETVASRVTELLPAGIRSRLPGWKTRARRLSLRYLCAYAVLFALTFAEVWIGFCILRVDFAFLLALLTALVDLLPILGVGTVLVPFSVLSFLRGRTYLGFGLLILYAVVLLIRQILEPRLIGKSLGLHPLTALFAGFAGWRWGGVPGMMLGPITAFCLKAVLLFLFPGTFRAKDPLPDFPRAGGETVVKNMSKL